MNRPGSGDAPARRQVAVCICTYRRPEVLRGLLQRLVDVAADAAEVAEVGVVVVDDDPENSARGVVDEFRDAFALGLRDANTASGNIAVARNRALELGLDTGDWLAMIDDDCMPSADWLRQLLAVQTRFDADAVSGACIDAPPRDGPRWLTDEPFLDEFRAIEDGREIDMGPIKNTLVAAEFLRRTGLRFDVPFGRLGAEDVMFMYSAHRLGVHHRFAAAAVVREDVPAARATLRYQLRRRLWYGTTESLTCVASGRYTRRRMAVSGAKKLALALTRPGRRIIRRQPVQWRFTVAEFLHGLGRMLGAGGIRLRHR